MSTLRESGESADVVFVVGKSKFPAHRALVSARCDQLAELLKKKAAREVVIDGVEPDVFEEILTFLYAGTIPKEFHTKVLKLIPAVDTFGIEWLKAICQFQQRHQLNLDNVCQTLLVAHKHDCEYLRVICFAFIKSRLEEVTKQPIWSKIMSTPELAKEFRSFLNDPNTYGAVTSTGR